MHRLASKFDLSSGLAPVAGHWYESRRGTPRSSRHDSPFEWLIDRELLRQFPQRYARAVDERDHDALAALFDPDGTVDGTFGQQNVADYLETMGRDPTRGGHRACTCSPTRSSSSKPGADTAHLDTYAVVYQVPDRQR